MAQRGREGVAKMGPWTPLAPPITDGTWPWSTISGSASTPGKCAPGILALLDPARESDGLVVELGAAAGC